MAASRNAEFWSISRFRLDNGSARCDLTNSPMACKELITLYKSANFVVVSKSPDVKINSDDPKDLVTMATQLADEYPQLVDSSLVHSFRFVHRLDYATSGALCVALSKASAGWACKAFSSGHVTKHYLALVYGYILEAIQDINIAIGEDSSAQDIHKMCTADQPQCVHPRHACTHMVVLQRGCYGDQAATKVLLIPKTGRTHQLRVHCLYAGHRIVGDYMYSGRQDSGPPRMMLHAYHLHMDMTQEQVRVTTSDPFVPASVKDWHPKEDVCSYEQYCEQLKGGALQTSPTDRAAGPTLRECTPATDPSGAKHLPAATLS